MALAFNPLLPKDDASRVNIDVDKVKDWMAKGAQPTDRVKRLLDGLGVLKREARNNPEKSKPKKKAQERLAAAAAKEEEAKAAAEAPAEEAPAAEAPAGEAPAEEAAS